MRALESWLLSYLLNSIWQVPLLFAAGWLAAKLLRPLGALAEYRVWVAVLIAQSLLPALSVFSWEWLASLPFWRGGAGADAGNVTVTVNASSAAGGVYVAAWLLAALALAYCLGCIFSLARLTRNLRALRRLRAEAIPLELSEEQKALWESVCRRFNVRNAEIAASNSVSSPLTFGVARKLLLVPPGMLNALAPEEVAQVLAHECAHMQREDFARNLAYEFVALPVCFHPLSHLTKQFLSGSREMVCDELAAGAQDRTQYARTLLHLAALLVETPLVPTPQAIGIFDTHIFERRVMNLTRRSMIVRGMRRTFTLAACAVFGAMTAVTLVALHTNVDAVAAASQESASSHGKPLHVASGDMVSNRISGLVPKYPKEAKEHHIQGIVILDAVINKKGEVENLKVKSGPKELQQSSLDAVKDWKYRPYLLNGNPTEVETTIKVTYTLKK
ncbi:MAG TPA: M56 family metallopeptidase [Terracidiphilus sp.]|nr:M56 family metallopeptidase [Terracidiphilus sp.]